MKKQPEVEDARALMTEAVSWSVLRWLREKKRVRRAADQANSLLWAMQKEVKSRWSDGCRAAYAELISPAGNSGPAPNAEARLLAKRVKEADEEADRAHQDAEDTFDKAEKILSTSLAREGCRKAIQSWELYEKAIETAEAGVRAAKAAK